MKKLLILIALGCSYLSAADNCYNYMSEETVRNLFIPKIKDHDTKKLFEPGLGIDDSDCFVFDNSKKDGYYFIKNNQLIHMSPKKKSILLDLPADKPINSLKSGPVGSGLCCIARGNYVQVIDENGTIKCSLPLNEQGQAYAEISDKKTLLVVLEKKPKKAVMAHVDISVNKGYAFRLNIERSIFDVKKYDSNIFALRGHNRIWFFDERSQQSIGQMSVADNKRILDMAFLPATKKIILSLDTGCTILSDFPPTNQECSHFIQESIHSVFKPSSLGVANQDSQKFNLLYSLDKELFFVGEWGLEPQKLLKRNLFCFTNSVRKLPKLKIDPFNSEKIAVVTEDNVYFSDRKKYAEAYINYSEQEREECLSFYNNFDKQKYEKPEDYINMLTLLENIGSAQKNDSTYMIIDKNTYRTYKLLPKLLQKGFENLNHVDYD